MSVLRPNPTAGKNGIYVKCPKCQAQILVVSISRQEPVRCKKCNYPLMLHTDFLSIVSACKNIHGKKQVDAAISILSHLSGIVPEAGSAYGMMAICHSFTYSEEERWNMLLHAYQEGDMGAKEWLNMLCSSYPEKYKMENCKNCGAPKYIERCRPDKSTCAFCKM